MKQELLQAARLIQNYCRSHEDCEECPLLNDEDDCELQMSSPHWWSIADDAKEEDR